MLFVMIMKNKINKIYFIYFRDLFKWQISVFLLFALAFIVSFLVNGFCKSIPLIVIWIILVLFTLEMIKFCVSVYMEMTKNEFSQKTITVCKIYYAKPFNFYGRTGKFPYGNVKLIIEDDEKELFHIVSDKYVTDFEMNELLGKRLIVTYLPQNRFVVKLSLDFDYKKINKNSKLTKFYIEKLLRYYINLAV